MRILFQGAGAIGIAGAALFSDRHEVVVVTRAPMPRPRAVYPRQVGWLDPDGARRSGGRAGSAHQGVAATRRVTVTDWAGIDAAGGFRWTPAGGDGSRPAGGEGVTIDQARRHAQHGRRQSARERRIQDTWDLVVLTTRPGDLDEAVAAAIRAVAPRWVAITSQVDGDLGVARSLFPGAEVVLFGPAIISERVDSPAGGVTGAGSSNSAVAADDAAAPDARQDQSIEPGREVRCWSPVGAPVFLVAGRTHPVRRLSRALGSLVVPVPMGALIVPPAIFIPFVAQLSARGGEWCQLLTHLRRPSAAAAEAIRGLTGVPVPVNPVAARIVLETLDRVSPIPMREYAGRHFARHEGQTLEMLAGWIVRAKNRGVGHASLSHLGEDLRRQADRA